MKPWRGRKPIIPEQFRPDDDRERIPVHKAAEVHPDAQSTEAGHLDSELLIGTLDGLAAQLATLRVTVTGQEFELSASRAECDVRTDIIRELVEQLGTAQRAFEHYGADLAILAAIKPSSSALLFAGHLRPRPDASAPDDDDPISPDTTR